MSRKNSLLEISKAYEQILNETNIAIEPSAQNTLLKNTMKPYSQEENEEIQFVVPKQSAEDLYNTSQQIDAKPECPCDSGKCGEEESEECDVDDHSNYNMAKSEAFKILNYAQDIMDLLGTKPKVEAWMLAKLVTAADYLCSVRGVMHYDDYEKNVEREVDGLSNDMNLVSKITQMLSGENQRVNEEVLKRTIFNLEVLKSK
jgi:hypothetical protein